MYTELIRYERTVFLMNVDRQPLFCTGETGGAIGLKPRNLKLNGMWRE